MNAKSFAFFAMLLAVGCGSAAMRGDGESLQSSSEALDTGLLNGAGLPDKTLVLTYDDGPGERTEELSGYLHAQGIRATFFVTGQQSEARPAALARLVADGHRLANHTQTHTDLTTLSAAGVLDEVRSVDALIGRYNTDGHAFFRPPYMAWSGAVRTAFVGSVLDKYIGPVNADIGSQSIGNYAADWACWQEAHISSAACAELYMNEIRDRRSGIVLLHDPWGDASGNTVDMTKILVPKLKAEGYRFASLEAVPAIAARLPVVPVRDAGGPVADSALPPVPDSSLPPAPDAGAQIDAGEEADEPNDGGLTEVGGGSGTGAAGTSPASQKVSARCSAAPGAAASSSWLIGGALAACLLRARRRR